MRTYERTDRAAFIAHERRGIALRGMQYFWSGRRWVPTTGPAWVTYACACGGRFATPEAVFDHTCGCPS